MTFALSAPLFPTVFVRGGKWFIIRRPKAGSLVSDLSLYYARLSLP